MKNSGYSIFRPLESRRNYFFRIGLVISLFLTFVAFEWRTPLTRVEIVLPDRWDNIEEEIMPVTYSRNSSVADQNHAAPRKNLTVFSNQITIVPNTGTVDPFPLDTVLNNPIVPVTGRPEVDTVAEEYVLLPEIRPEFPGNDEALLEYLSGNIKYPAKAREAGANGTVYMNFIIETDGSVSTFECLRSPHQSLTDEALRVLTAMPKWKPGMQGGKAVRVRMALPVNFTLK